MTPDPESPPHITRAQAARLVSHKEFKPLRRLFDVAGPRLATETARHFSGYDRGLLTRNPDNYGLYFVRAGVRTPFLWLGVAWRKQDPPGTLPAWGASLEVDGDAVRRLDADAAGLKQAFERAAAGPGQIRVHRFERHVELAHWRDFDWLLGQDDQPAALTGLWAVYLEFLEQAELPAAVQRFIDELSPRTPRGAP
jgi:hypothetical protein